MPGLWLPNRPDLNPVDYKIGLNSATTLPEKVQGLTHSRQHLIDARAAAAREQNIIDDAIDQWRRHLHASIRARGHFHFSL